MTQLLRDVIHVLTRPHLRRTTNTEGETIYGEEPALLDILEEEIAASSQIKVGGTSKTGVPIALDAFQLAQDIKAITQAHWPVNGLLKAPLRLRVTAWYNNTHDPNDALSMYDTVSTWESRIREIVQPTKKVPMRGLRCIKCNCTHVEKVSDEGATYDAAITVYPGAEPVYAKCGVCETEWSGKELHILAAQGLTSVTGNVIQ